MAMFDHSRSRSLRTIVPDRDPVPFIRPRSGYETRGDDRLVVRFGVGGHPCQWVTHGTSGTKAIQRANMRGWKTKVANAAALAMRDVAGIGPRGGYRPAKVETGYVEVWADFVVRPDDPRIPDRTNLLKALEDALQGIVYTNDVMVIGGDCRRFIGPYEGVDVEVWAVQPLSICRMDETPDCNRKSARRQ